MFVTYVKNQIEFNISFFDLSIFIVMRVINL